MGLRGTTTSANVVGLDVIPAPDALADLVSPFLCCAFFQPVLDPADPNVLHLVALQPRNRLALAPRLAPTRAGALE